MKKVRKAVIPAAGFGTRFLPATKAMAKEMLPIVDKPTIQFIVEEAIASGIEDILIVTGKSKRPIEDHFDSNIELEANLREKGKNELLELVQETTGLRIHFVRQSYPLGLGHAVLQAKAFVGDEPFVVMLGDDLMEDEVPLTKQLMDAYERTHASNIAVMEVPHEETSKYGIIDPDRQRARAGADETGPQGTAWQTFHRGAHGGATHSSPTATISGERSIMEGMIKLAAFGASTTLQKIRRDSAAVLTLWLTASSSVAAIASQQVLSRDSSNGPSTSVSMPSSAHTLNCGINASALTVKRAPASSSNRALRSATSPPPTIKQSRSRS